MELFPSDSVILETETSDSTGSWCSRQLVVRKEEDDEDFECSGCSLNVKFVDYSDPFTPRLELLQANYSIGLYYGPQVVNFQSLVRRFRFRLYFLQNSRISLLER